jgi:hypothetical protein
MDDFAIPKWRDEESQEILTDHMSGYANETQRLRKIERRMGAHDVE